MQVRTCIKITPTCIAKPILFIYSHTVTKSEPRRIWANIVLPCEEEDLVELKKEHKEADQVLDELARKRMQILEEINKVKEELNRYQTEEMLVKKVNSQPTSSQPKPTKRYVKQRTLCIPNEVCPIIFAVGVHSCTNNDTEIQSSRSHTGTKHGLGIRCQKCIFWYSKSQHVR